MKVRLIPLVLAIPLALTACGNSSDNTDSTHAITSAESPTSQLNPPHEAIEAPGVTLTLNSITESDHLMLNAEGYEPGYLPEERQEPVEGGKFITVNTKVENTGKKSMDLTCGLAVQVGLFNEDDQQYDPIQDLYRIPGNPECNHSLNPGFDIEMTWSFEVPKDMKATKFGFADPETHYDDFTFIDVTKADSRKETSKSEDTPRPTHGQQEQEEQQAQPAQPAQDEPYVVECLFGTPGPSRMSDGSTIYTDYCFDKNGGPAYLESESWANSPDNPAASGHNQNQEPSPWVQGQIDWANCLEAGNTEEYCREVLN